MNDWCAAFMLQGNRPLDMFLHWQYDESVKGNFQDGEHVFDNTPVEKNDAGSYLMLGQPNEVLPIPSRNATLVSWWYGTADLSAATQRLINLNKTERHEKTSYVNTLLDQVFIDKGTWAATMAYLSNKSNVVVAARNCTMYMWFVRFREAFVIACSTDPDHMKQATSLLTESQQDEFMAFPVEVTNAVCVLQPTYLIGRWRRAWHKTYCADRLAAVSYLGNYLRRRVQPLK